MAYAHAPRRRLVLPHGPAGTPPRTRRRRPDPVDHRRADLNGGRSADGPGLSEANHCDCRPNHVTGAGRIGLSSRWLPGLWPEQPLTGVSGAGIRAALETGSHLEPTRGESNALIIFPVA